MRCWNPQCQNEGDGFKTCAGCRGAAVPAHYCGPVCQKQHWQVHKLTCKKAHRKSTPVPAGDDDGPSCGGPSREPLFYLDGEPVDPGFFRSRVDRAWMGHMWSTVRRGGHFQPTTWEQAHAYLSLESQKLVGERNMCHEMAYLYPLEVARSRGRQVLRMKSANSDIEWAEGVGFLVPSIACPPWVFMGDEPDPELSMIDNKTRRRLRTRAIVSYFSMLDKAPEIDPYSLVGVEVHTVDNDPIGTLPGASAGSARLHFPVV